MSLTLPNLIDHVFNFLKAVDGENEVSFFLRFPINNMPLVPSGHKSQSPLGSSLSGYPLSSPTHSNRRERASVYGFRNLPSGGTTDLGAIPSLFEGI